MFAGVAFAANSWTLNVGNRQAIIYAPDKRDKPALVLALHGMGLSKEWAQGAMKFEPLADTANFVVAYPGSDGSQWDLGSNKDVDFIVAVIDSMANRYQIDRNRVYVTGFSMGGMMSWYLSCRIPDKIAAMVPDDGFLLGGMPGDCSEVRHVPAMEIHGNCDFFVKYTDFVGSFLPSQVSRYGCPATPVKTSPYPVNVDGRNASQLAQPSKSFLESYGPCEKSGLKSELSLLTVNGMLHDWATPDKANTNDQAECPGYLGKPLDINGTWEAWNWLKTHSLAGDIPVVTVPAHRDTIFNGGFTQGVTAWTFNTWGGTAQGSVVNGEYKIDISALGTGNSSIQLVQNGIILQQGKSYEVKFDAYASANRTLEANVELDVSPWTSYLPELKAFNLTTSKTTYSYTFTMTNATDSNGRISFNAGASTTGLFIDNVSIKEVPTPVAVHVQATMPGIAMRWTNGILILTGMESGKLQITDSRGLSQTLNVTYGQAKTGLLPAGLYHVRLLGKKSGNIQSFVVEQ